MMAGPVIHLRALHLGTSLLPTSSMAKPTMYRCPSVMLPPVTARVSGGGSKQAQRVAGPAARAARATVGGAPFLALHVR